LNHSYFYAAILFEFGLSLVITTTQTQNLIGPLVYSHGAIYFKGLNTFGIIYPTKTYLRQDPFGIIYPNKKLT
jgi:hypothetical protein